MGEILALRRHVAARSPVRRARVHGDRRRSLLAPRDGHRPLQGIVVSGVPQRAALRSPATAPTTVGRPGTAAEGTMKDERDPSRFLDRRSFIQLTGAAVTT